MSLVLDLINLSGRTFNTRYGDGFCEFPVLCFMLKPRSLLYYPGPDRSALRLRIGHRFPDRHYSRFCARNRTDLGLKRQ